MKRRIPFVASVVTLCLFSLGFRTEDVSISDPVNIYLYDGRLFVSDARHGILIYSVTEPSRPEPMLHIPIQGNTGMAVRGDILYANSHGSLLAIRVYDDSLYKVEKVIRAAPSCCGGDFFYPGYRGGVGCGCSMSAPGMDSRQSGIGSGTGMGGSYAVFAVIDSFLYYLDQGNVVVTMDISTPQNPRELSRTYVDWSIETLFPTAQYLYIGGTRGMYVLDRTTPAQPRMIGWMEHFRACDPVVVQDSTAYVTLRGGGPCGGARDVLLSVDVSDPAKPRTLDEIDVGTPYGLTVNDTLVYVARGSAGFDLYSVADPRDIRRIAGWSTPAARDFIWDGRLLYLMGVDRVEIFDVTDPLAPVPLGSIE